MSALFERRLSATLIDTLVYGLILGAGLALGISLSDFPAWAESPFMFAGLTFPLLILSLLESMGIQSPGRRLNELELRCKSGSFNWLRLCWRNLLKYGLLGTAFVILPLLLYQGIFQNQIRSQLLSGLILGLGLTVNLGLLRKDFWQGQSFFDWASGTQTLASSVAYRQDLLRWLSLGAGSALSLASLMIMLPKLMPACGCGGPSVKANMHTLQTMVETYAVDWGGLYPDNLETLQREAQNTDTAYWKDLINPIPQQTKEKLLFWEHEVTKADLRGLGYSIINEGQPVRPGSVSYLPEANQTRYWIYGYNKDGQRIQNQGHDFALSNS